MSKWNPILVSDYHERDPRGGIIISAQNDATFYSKYGPVHIRCGDLSDGASVPRFFWPLVSPLDSDMVNAAWPHDVIYRDVDTDFSRWEADKILIEAMKDQGAPLWKRAVVFTGVRAGGWRAWNRYRRNKGKIT